MPDTFNIGDRVRYQRSTVHARNGAVGTVILEEGPDYVVRFDRADIRGYHERVCAIGNLFLIKLKKVETVLDVIKRLHERQHFYKTIGKDLGRGKIYND